MATLDEEASLRHSRSNALETLLLLSGVLAVSALFSWLMLGVLGVAAAVLVIGLFFLFGGAASGRLVLRMLGARPLSAGSAPGLYELLTRLCRRAGLKRCPTLFYIPDSASINAFTTEWEGGVGIALSHGILSTLTRREMAGVLAHELSHAVHGDLRLQAFVQLLGRLTALMGNFFQVLLILNLPFILAGQMIVPFWLLLALAAGPAALLWLQAKLSQVREFDADLGAVRVTGDPEGLVSALRKLGWFERQYWGVLRRMLGRREPPKWARTHPDTDERIALLEELSVPEPFDRFGGGTVRWIARDLMERFRG